MFPAGVGLVAQVGPRGLGVEIVLRGGVPQILQRPERELLAELVESIVHAGSYSKRHSARLRVRFHSRCPTGGRWRPNRGGRRTAVGNRAVRACLNQLVAAPLAPPR